MARPAGDAGVDLQGVHDIIIFDASWNPQHDICALQRVTRACQKSGVHVYKLFCRNSVD